MDRSQYLTVSELTKYLKMKFDRDPYLHTVYLTGELSNFRLRQKHQYFSLKDDNAVIDAVMFEHQFRKIKFTPEQGMKVCVVGHVSLYEKSGRYQIYIDRMEPDGLGSLYLAFEQLKKKLSAEGLFNLPKKQVPMFPLIRLFGDAIQLPKLFYTLLLFKEIRQQLILLGKLTVPMTVETLIPLLSVVVGDQWKTYGLLMKKWLPVQLPIVKFR